MRTWRSIPIHDPTALYRLPFPDRRTFPITQAYGGSSITHTTPDTLYAVDFTMPVGTPIIAARAGTIIKVDHTNEYTGQEPILLNKANTIIILHDDGTMALYAHLAPGQPLVNVGQHVSEGQQIAVSGNTGYSTGPHLHFAVLKNTIDGNGAPHLISLSFRFYVGQPPEAFEPRAGLLATANYSTPAISLRLARTDLPPARIMVSDPNNVLHRAPLRTWLAWTGLVLLISTLLLTRYRSTLRPSRHTVISSPTTASTRYTPEQRLLLACHGDRVQTERLIEYETRRAPLISKAEAAHRALQRLERERG